MKPVRFFPAIVIPLHLSSKHFGRSTYFSFFFYDLVISDVDHNLSCHGRPISSSYDLDLSSNTNRDASVELSSIQTLWP